MLGLTAATISRYEAGKITPRQQVLWKLGHLTDSEEEKTNILGWIKELYYPASSLNFPEGPYSWERYDKRRWPLLHRFVLVARSIDARGEEIDPALVKMIELWDRHHSDPAMAQHFRACARFLEASIRQTKSETRAEASGCGERTKTSARHEKDAR